MTYTLYAKTPEQTMENMSKVIIMVVTVVIVVIMTISNSSPQAKVYTVASLTIFSTVVLGLFVGKKSIMDHTQEGWQKRMILCILLCLTVIVPQLKYMTVVIDNTRMIRVQAQLPYNGAITSITVITMACVIGAMYLADIRTDIHAQQGILMKWLIGCSVLSSLSYMLVSIMAERLKRMNANVLDVSDESNG